MLKRRNGLAAWSAFIIRRLSPAPRWATGHHSRKDGARYENPVWLLLAVALLTGPPAARYVAPDLFNAVGRYQQMRQSGSTRTPERQRTCSRWRQIRSATKPIAEPSRAAGRSRIRLPPGPAARGLAGARVWSPFGRPHELC